MTTVWAMYPNFWQTPGVHRHAAIAAGHRPNHGGCTHVPQRIGNRDTLCGDNYAEPLRSVALSGGAVVSRDEVSLPPGYMGYISLLISISTGQSTYFMYPKTYPRRTPRTPATRTHP